MIRNQFAAPSALAVAFSLGLGACGAASQPPKELIDARAAYQHAQASNARELDPTALHEAETALQAAERANADDPNSSKTQALSYVAERRAELAEVRGNTLASLQSKQTNDKQLALLQAQALTQSQGALRREDAELNTSKQQLATTRGELSQEKAAREAAEQRTREAMDKLSVAAALAVKDEPRGTVITIPGNVLFQTAKTALLPAAQTKLAQVAAALKDESDHKIVIEGHTDSQGSAESNLDLSQRRAQSVRDYLVSQGVPAEKISAVGIGMDRPVADNGSVEGRAQNRRVEIIVQPVEAR